MISRRAFLAGCAALGLAIGVPAGLATLPSAIGVTTPGVVWEQEASPVPEASTPAVEPLARSTPPSTAQFTVPSAVARQGAARTVAVTAPERTRKDTKPVSTQPEQPTDDPVPPPPAATDPAPADDDHPDPGPPLKPIPVTEPTTDDPPPPPPG